MKCSMQVYVIEQKIIGLGCLCVLIWKRLEKCDPFNHYRIRDREFFVRGIGYQAEGVIIILERLSWSNFLALHSKLGKSVSNPNAEKNLWSIKVP